MRRLSKVTQALRLVHRTHNPDLRCAAPTACQRKTGTVCNRCRMAAYNSSPERRARHSATMKALAPQVAAKLHAHAMRRAGVVDEAMWAEYQRLVERVGARQARLVIREMRARRGFVVDTPESCPPKPLASRPVMGD